MTVFAATHQLSVAEEMEDRIGLVHGGKLVAARTREELCQQSGIAGALEDIFLSLVAGEARGANKLGVDRQNIRLGANNI